MKDDWIKWILLIALIIAIIILVKSILTGTPR